MRGDAAVRLLAAQVGCRGAECGLYHGHDRRNRGRPLRFPVLLGGFGMDVIGDQREGCCAPVATKMYRTNPDGVTWHDKRVLARPPAGSRGARRAPSGSDHAMPLISGVLLGLGARLEGLTSLFRPAFPPGARSAVVHATGRARPRSLRGGRGSGRRRSFRSGKKAAGSQSCPSSSG